MDIGLEGKNKTGIVLNELKFTHTKKASEKSEAFLVYKIRKSWSKI